MAVEIARHLPCLARKRKLDQALLLAALQVMPIEWKPASVYEDHREQAESRIARRDPDDWPTLALASGWVVGGWRVNGSNEGWVRMGRCRVRAEVTASLSR